MINKLPRLLDKHRICIICEGNEEYEYLERLKALKVWNAQYDITLINAGGNGNIPAKHVNTPLIKKYTGIENYKGRANQIEQVMEHVTAENYADMCQRIEKMETVDTITGSSNFGRFIKWFESDDSGWIEKINEQVE